MRIVLVAIVIAGAPLAGGCARPGEFQRVAPEQTIVPLPAEEGARKTSEDRPPPEVHVWSEGAYRGMAQGEEATLLLVRLDIENPTGETLAVESVHLDEVTLEDGRMNGMAPLEVIGPQTIAPGERVQLDAYFRFPEAQEPDDIEAFTVGWQLRHGQTRYRQNTTFGEREPAVDIPGADDTEIDEPER